MFSTAEALPKEVAYSEDRLHPPNGYKDTTVPGIWAPDTPLSHKNTQHGWITAPGMQGTQVGPVTAGLLTPQSLAELMGGPDIAPVQSNLQTPPGPPNAYDEYPVLPPIGLQAPQVPIPPPPPGPEVIPGPVAPTPAPVSGPQGRHPQDRRCPLRRRPPRQEVANEAMVVSGPPPGPAGSGATGGRACAELLRELARNCECADARRPGWPGSYTVYVQMPDTLALNDNSRVRVADVFVGTVRAIKLRNWVATLTLVWTRASSYPKTPLPRSGRQASWALSMWSWRRHPTRPRSR